MTNTSQPQRRMGAGEVLREITTLLESISGNPLFAYVSADLFYQQLIYSLCKEATAQKWSRESTSDFLYSCFRSYLSEKDFKESIECCYNPSDEYLELFDADTVSPENCFFCDCLLMAIKAGLLNNVIEFFRSFVQLLSDFAYMEGNPCEGFYFVKIATLFNNLLENQYHRKLPPNPLKVTALGGSIGKAEGDTYPMLVSVDISNPNKWHTAYNVRIDIVLKNQQGEIVDTIHDRIGSICPLSVFHYGIIRNLSGDSVTEMTAEATPENYQDVPYIANPVSFTTPKLVKTPEGMTLTGTLANLTGELFKCSAFHYQLLTEKNEILGGGNVPIDNFGDNPITVTCNIPVTLTKTSKILYSINHIY